MITKEKTEDITRLIKKQMEGLEFPLQPSSLYDPVRYMLASEGKCIRFYLTLLGCGLCGGNIHDALPSATAIELLHNFTLLHDDIMDSASTRRGKQSVFKKWDASTAILSGDAMYAWAFEQLQCYGKNEKFSKLQYAGILDIFLDSAKTVCEGQAHDLDFENASDVSLADYEQMIYEKTAALIVGALKMGGIVANASGECIERLDNIGKHVGIGFQIQDDLLDVVADPDKFGKQQGGDIKEGKKTYLSILLSQRIEYSSKKRVDEMLGNPDIDQQDIDHIINHYKYLGIIRHARQKIKMHYNQAIELIEPFPDNAYKKEILKFLTNLKNREY